MPPISKCTEKAAGPSISDMACSLINEAIKFPVLVQLLQQVR